MGKHGCEPVMDRSGAASSSLLEHQYNTVTDSENGGGYELAKHRCRCWYCPDCMNTMGRQLRDKLVPILGTFSEIMMWTFTVDPKLFDSPRDAYFYVRENRCIARTIADIWEAGYLHSRRYWYVVEWQRDTKMAHYHVLLDASFIPWDFVLASWDKHRPPEAGPVQINPETGKSRPAFGTVRFSKGTGAEDGEFQSVEHAANYVVKYLKKLPEYGFPAWVLDMGAETRIRRYSASRGFWGTHTERAEAKGTTPKHQAYRTRVERCGSSVDVYEVQTRVDTSTGELIRQRAWVGELDLPASALRDIPTDRPERSRRLLHVPSLATALLSITMATGQTPKWKHRGKTRASGMAPALSEAGATAKRIEHARYGRMTEQEYATMCREFLESN